MDTTTLTATSAEAATATATAAVAAGAASLSSTSPTLASNLQLCRICISSNVNCTQMISLFGEDSLWRKITTLADVKIERGDILPQQVCLTCAKNIISAYLFKKKCEDADSFYRQQLFLHKTVPQNNGADSEGEDEFNNGENIQHSNGQDNASSHSYKHHQRPVNGSEEIDEDEDDHNLHPQISAHQFKPDPEDDERRDNEEDDEEDSEEQQQLHIDDSGEVKSPSNGLKPFDFNSIRLMHEYMQQHLSKFNGLQQGNHAAVASDEEAAGADGSGSDSDPDDDDDGPLPLIPEIELITPSEICDNGTNNGNAASGDGQAMTQMRGYQCPHCYQIFEMKQLLKTHMQSVHGAAGPVYECTNCKKTYFYKRFLEKHIRRGRCVKKRRNQTRPMQCSDCNVLFPTGHHLGWHKRTGCPSKTAKMPLQQLFKQNIVQYNNFPRRGGGRKPENALYLHNRKLVMANNKRKGRTRIKLDARKIALAKQLILREATTTVIANELNISRTFAWRLRKSLVNGISLHERVIDPTEEEDDDGGANCNADEVVENVAQKAENLLNHHPFTEHFIKSENIASEDEEVEQGGQNDSEADFNQHGEHHEMQQYDQPQQQDDEEDEDDDDHEYLQQMQLRQQLKQHDNVVATSVIQRATTTASNEHMIAAVQLKQQHQAIEQKLHNISVVQQQRLMELQPNNNTRTPHLEQQQNASPPGGSLNHKDAGGAESDEENQMTEDDYRLRKQQQQHERETDLNTKCGVNSQEYTKNNSLKNAKSSPLINNGKLPLITQLSPAIAAAIHQLPVNLSIRPIASMQNNETSPSNNNNNNTNNNSNKTPNGNSSKKKPRKPNVFIDDEKYAMAKMLVAQNASTMEIAKALNVSQMTAWKLRDAIIKGVPLSYRNKRDIRMTMVRPEEEASGSCGAVSESSEGRRETDSERKQQALLVKQQLEHQQKLQQQHIQQQQQIQQLLQRQQQLQQQQHQLEQQKLKQQRELEEEEEQRQLLVQQQQQLQQQQQQQRQQQLQSKQEQKHLNPRRRLKAAERELRDKEITREILELIREDNNIQYWKVSARLAEKGYAISPSSVCQKLKSMGIHRRWKPGDKPPLIDMEHLKANTNNSVAATTASLNLSQAANSSLAAATLAANAASSSADESYEQQFDMGGAHFLSAFTR